MLDLPYDPKSHRYIFAEGNVLAIKMMNLFLRDLAL